MTLGDFANIECLWFSNAFEFSNVFIRAVNLPIEVKSNSGDRATLGVARKFSKKHGWHYDVKPISNKHRVSYEGIDQLGNHGINTHFYNNGEEKVCRVDVSGKHFHFSEVFGSGFEVNVNPDIYIGVWGF